MYILAIETTGAFASVCLVRADEQGGIEVLSSILGQDKFSHLQNLTPQIQKVLDESELSIGDVTKIAVSEGPGSFTGIRIGISTARALSQVTGIGCVPVPTLAALAGRVTEIYSQKELEGKLVCPILDARRSQVYGGGYKIENGKPLEVVKAGPYTIDQFLEAVKGYEEYIFLGDGVDTCGDKLPENAECPESIRYQNALQVAELAVSADAKAYGNLEPNYMRIPEAERNLREKQRNKNG